MTPAHPVGPGRILGKGAVGHFLVAGFLHGNVCYFKDRSGRPRDQQIIRGTGPNLLLIRTVAADLGAGGAPQHSVH